MSYISQPAKRMAINWRTSAPGIVSIFVGALNVAKEFQNGNWSNDIPFVATNLSAVVVGIGLLFARDSAVTSEQCGITPTQQSVNESKPVENKP